MTWSYCESFLKVSSVHHRNSSHPLLGISMNPSSFKEAHILIHFSIEEISLLDQCLNCTRQQAPASCFCMKLATSIARCQIMRTESGKLRMVLFWISSKIALIVYTQSNSIIYSVFSRIIEGKMEKYPLQQQIPRSRQQFPLLLSYLQFNRK